MNQKSVFIEKAKLLTLRFGSAAWNLQHSSKCLNLGESGVYNSRLSQAYRPLQVNTLNCKFRQVLNETSPSQISVLFTQSLIEMVYKPRCIVLCNSYKTAVFASELAILVEHSPDAWVSEKEWYWKSSTTFEYWICARHCQHVLLFTSVVGKSLGGYVRDYF